MDFRYRLINAMALEMPKIKAPIQIAAGRETSFNTPPNTGPNPVEMPQVRPYTLM